MIDQREVILARLEVILSGITGFEYAGRNPVSISETLRPAVAFYDGDEQRLIDPPSPRRAGAAPPVVIRMKPPIIVAAETGASNVGTETNAARRLVLTAILSDATLLQMTFNGAGLIYDGGQFGLSKGEKTQGDITIDLSIDYLFKPSDLVA